MKNAPYHTCAPTAEALAGLNPNKLYVSIHMEREDAAANEICHTQLHERTGWSKESDSSLDDCTGYVLVSPLMEVGAVIAQLREAFQGDDEVRRLFSATRTRICGTSYYFYRGGEVVYVSGAMAGAILGLGRIFKQGF